jgi:hypothetical protein
LQLGRASGLVLALACAARVAHAEDHAEVSTSVFEEKRDGGKGGLTVVHPAAGFGVDLGRYVTFDLAYAADAVSGATASVYQVDAISTATTFSDTRHEVTTALGFQGRRSKLAFSGTFGIERDYISKQLGGNGSIDLPGRNTTVALAYTHSWDQVCDRDNSNSMPLERIALSGADPCPTQNLLYGKNSGNVVWHDLSIDTAQTTITQNLTPTMNLQGALYGQILDGFQSNPYRRVVVGGVATQEHEPNTRARWSVSARLNRYLPKLHSAVHFSARFYDDTWRVIGGDVELAYSQYIGNSLLLRVHARVYQQTAASFFKDAFFYMTESTAGEFYTGDRELSPVRDAVVGGKLTLLSIGKDKKVWKVFDKLELNVKADVLFLSRLPAEDPSTNSAGIDKQFIYGNNFLDAIILQLGLAANY